MSIPFLKGMLGVEPTLDSFNAPLPQLPHSLHCYYNTVASRCQEVFEIFSNFFLRESTLPCSLLNPYPLDNYSIAYPMRKCNRQFAQILGKIFVQYFHKKQLTNLRQPWYNQKRPASIAGRPQEKRSFRSL